MMVKNFAKSFMPKCVLGFVEMPILSFFVELCGAQRKQRGKNDN